MLDPQIRLRRLMSCLGEPSRFQLVRQLLRGERCVSDLARQVGLSQSCTTRHLQALQREQVVRGERAGKRVLFRLCLDEPQVGALLGWAMSARAGKHGVPVPDRLHPTHGADLHSEGPEPDTAPSVSSPPAHIPANESARAPAAALPAERSPAGRATHDGSPERPAGMGTDPAPARPRPPRHDLEDFLL